MAHIQIPDTAPRVQYSVGATPDSDFTIPFAYFADADIVVYVDDTLQTITTDYTVSGTAVDEGYSGGTVNMVSAVTNAVVTIYRDVSVARSTDFPTNGQFDITQLNTELDKMTMMIQQNEHNLGLTLRTDQFDETANLTIPNKATRANSYLKFDTNGAPVTITDDQLVDVLGGSIIGANYITNNATGDGTTVNFTLSSAPGAKGNLQIYIDGVYQNKATFSLAGTTVTFTEAPPLNASVEFIIGYSIGSTSGDATGIDFTQQGTGAVTTTVAQKLWETVSVKDFGAVGDGVTDDTAALIRAANSMTDGSTMYFPSGTYLISHSGFGSFTAAYGNYVFELYDVDNVKITGDGATIKVVNHDISTYGGLGMFKFMNCNGVTVSGFNFDMTFTGYKSSSAFYPQCGAMIFSNDSSADGQDPNDLSGDILIEHCEFKLFHPMGCWGRNADPANYYNGDYNNAFKIFSVFVSSPYQADQYENTGRNCTIRDCRIKEGHNAYGFWVWATYNAVFDNLVAESWVTKFTVVDTGVITGGGVPFIRHHQFRTEGAKVTNCYFRARPSSERTESGFEGSGTFINFTTNINEGLAKGEYIVANNIITHGGGDPVYTVDNTQILAYGYGNYIFDGNIFDGHDGENNGGTAIFLGVSNGSSAGGVSSVVISNNTWGKWSRSNNIQISTGNSTGAYNRRYQQVSITDNTSLSQSQYFLFLGDNSSHTYDGVQSLNVSNNIIDGTYSSWDKTSTNSRAISLKGTESTDSYIIAHNIIRSKYFGISNNTTNADVQTFGNKFIDVTDEFTDAVVTETISGHSQQSYFGEFEGAGECGLKVKALNGPANMQIYSQISQQYLQATNNINFYTDGANQVVLDDGFFRPAVDGDITLGTGTYKFGQIYSTVGSISTSDERKKQDIADLEQAELNVATALKGLIKKFKYKSAVADKGDDARTHIGVIAQEVKAAFEAEGLDPFEYGILCLDTWDDQYETNLELEEVLIKEAGEEYAIRYDELFAFIIAAL